MTSLELLTDAIVDPRGNGDYELHLGGEKLKLFWQSIEHDDTILRQWRRIQNENAMSKQRTATNEQTNP